MFKAPKFWSKKDSSAARLLRPLAKVYSFVTSARVNSVSPEDADVPVVCIGNVVLGGAGKTPAVKLACDILRDEAHVPHVLTSGYGGYLKNVVRIDPSRHSYLQVGDEALLSAMVAPTWVGKNRINAARAAILGGADVLVMDDGLQNNSIRKDLNVLAVDSGQGFGNEEVFPAGPLRETVDSGIRKSDIVLMIGDENRNLEERIRLSKKNIPICHAKMKVTEKLNIEDGRVIGFCGLGYPEKFRKTLIEEGLDVVDFIAFSDHHPYTITEIQKLIKASRNSCTKLITTMKDYVKIPDVFKNEVLVVHIELVTSDDLFSNILRELMQKKCKNG
jgi:tetraacyldisaccharide 4'-kinase